MRKDAIKLLIKKTPLNFRIQLLNLVLAQQDFMILNDDQDIPFKAVLDYCQMYGGFVPNDIAQEAIKGNKSDNDLFYVFITGNTRPISTKSEEKEEKKSKLMPQVSNNIIAVSGHIAQFLDPQSAAKFSSCSSAFYQNTTGALSWQHKILALGINKKLLNQLIADKIIHNYKKLYRALSHMGSQSKQQLHIWEIYCLSGEIKAIQFAIEKKGLTKEKTGRFGRNALHYAAQNGSVEAIQYAIDVLKIPANSVDNNGLNALHYATFSGSVEAVKFIRLLSHNKSLNLNPTVRDNNAHDAFFYVDRSKNPALIREVLNVPIKNLIDQAKQYDTEEEKSVNTMEKLQSSRCSIM